MAHYEVHVGTDASFTPETGNDSTTYYTKSSTTRAQLHPSALLPPGELRYLKFVHFDDHGNHGAPSESVAVTMPRTGPTYLSDEARLGAGFPYGVFNNRTRGAAMPPDGWSMVVGTWNTDAKTDNGTLYARPKTGRKTLLLMNTTVATRIRSDVKPCTPNRTHDLAVEVRASTIAEAVTFKAEWLDIDKNIVFTDLVYDDVMRVPDAWQVFRAQLVPPDAARYVRFSVEKSNSAYFVAVDRIIFEEAGAHGVEESLQSVLLRDQFIKDGTSAPWGDLGWAEIDLGGGGTVSKKAASAPTLDQWSESGVIELSAPASTNDGVGIALTSSMTRAPFYGLPPFGTVMQWKVRMTDDLDNYQCWVGVWSSVSTFPDNGVSNSISGFGIVSRPVLGTFNWFGVVRGGGTETLVDLGIRAQDGFWAVVGCRRTANGFQFTLDDDDVGDEVTDSLPSASTMTPYAGIISTNSSGTKELQIDDFGLRAVMARNIRIPDDDEELWTRTVAFGHSPAATQRRTIKVPDGYTLTRVSIRSTVNPTDGDVVIRRDNDGTLVSQLSSSPFDAATMTADDEAAPTLTGTTANRVATAESWLRIEVTNLAISSTSEGFEITVEYTRD